ncbi:MAG: hypothetical protein RL607_909 [Bacteroidota bacterium]|jgi:membrane protein YdbS with pleckstrin-like domain
MEPFTNNEIDVRELPKFETVTLQRLNAKYRRILALNCTVVLLIEIAILLILTFKPEDLSIQDILFFWLGGALLAFCIIGLTFLGFRKKGYAFRERDLIYQYGVIATNTKIIPYNRVQHVALHEGLIARYIGLAQVEIYTAGVHGGDIKIPGLLKEDAERIKQLLMGKIQKEL